MNRRAIVALVRVSTAEQSAEVQRLQIERSAPAYGIDPASIDFRSEDGVSGAAKVRPVLEKIMADARKGDIGTLVVVALDRLGRSTIDLLIRLEELNRLEVRVISLREALDYGTAAGRLVASILAAMAQFERSLIIERTKAGMTRAKEKGTRSGLAIGRPKIVWTERTEASLMGWVAQGYGPKQIAERGLLHLPTTNGKTVRVKATVLREKVREIRARAPVVEPSGSDAPAQVAEVGT